MTQKPSRRIRQVSLAGASVLAFGAATALTVNFASATPTDDSDDSIAVPSHCDLNVLPYPDEYGMSFGQAMDPTGTYLAGRGYPEAPMSSYERYLMIWEDEELTELDVDGGDQGFSGINSHGDASINTYIDDTDPTPMAYVDGEVVELAHDNPGQTRDINDDGVIVGSLETGADFDTTPVFWEAPDSEPVELELPDGVDSGSAAAIDGDTIAGTVRAPDHDDNIPVTWDLDGNLTELAGPDEADEFFGHVTDIRDGWMVGSLRLDGSEEPVAVRWNPDGEAEVISDGYAAAINAEGWIVGFEEPDQPLIWADDEVIELPVLDDGEFANNQALAISDDGSTIFGSVDTDADEVHSLAAAEWTCE